MRTLNDRTTRINQRLQRLARDQHRIISALPGSDEKIKSNLQLHSTRLSRSMSILQSMLDKEQSE